MSNQREHGATFVEIEGREIAVEIISATADHVIVKEIISGKQHRLPIAQLDREQADKKVDRERGT